MQTVNFCSKKFVMPNEQNTLESSSCMSPLHAIFLSQQYSRITVIWFQILLLAPSFVMRSCKVWSTCVWEYEVMCFTLPVVVEFGRTNCVVLLRLYYTHFYTVIIYCTYIIVKEIFYLNKMSAFYPSTFSKLNTVNCLLFVSILVL